MSCNHVWKTVNDVRVCLRCGLTMNRFDGSIMFDRKLTDSIKRRKGKRDAKDK